MRADFGVVGPPRVSSPRPGAISRPAERRSRHAIHRVVLPRTIPPDRPTMKPTTTTPGPGGLSRRPGVRGLVLLLATAMTSAAVAQSTAPLPDLSNQRVYVIETKDEYDPLRQEIATLERDSPQTYYVVILKSAGSGKRATRDYLNALVEKWEAQAKQGRGRFDTKRSVVTVVDLENRKIVV